MNFCQKDQNSCQMDSTALVWIRDDFRIQNNDALTYASNKHDVVTAVFIFNSSIFDHKREAQKLSLIHI